MKKLMVLGFLMMQGNNVECMTKRFASALKHQAYNWYTRGKNFSTQKQVEGKIERLLNPKDVNHVSCKLANVPGNKDLSTSIYNLTLHGGRNNTTVLSFGNKIVKPGERMSGEGNTRYILKNNFPEKTNKLLSRFEEEIIKGEEKLLKNELKEVNSKEIFDNLLNTEFKELRDSASIKQLARYKYFQPARTEKNSEGEDVVYGYFSEK